MGWEAASWRRLGSSGRTQRWHQEGHPRAKKKRKLFILVDMLFICFVIWKTWDLHEFSKKWHFDVYMEKQNHLICLAILIIQSSILETLSAELVPRWALSCCHVPRFLQNFLVSTEYFHPTHPGKQTPKSYEKPKAPVCDVCSLNNPNKQQINKQTLAYPKLFIIFHPCSKFTRITLLTFWKTSLHNPLPPEASHHRTADSATPGSLDAYDIVPHPGCPASHFRVSSLDIWHIGTHGSNKRGEEWVQ